MYSELFYRVALMNMEGFGLSTMKKIVRFSGSARAVFEEPDLWRSKVVRRGKVIPRLSITDALKRMVDEELDYMAKHDIRLCFLLDGHYPYRLKSCPDAPLGFYIQGNDEFNVPHVLAVVGTRCASAYGRHCVKKILSELQDFNVVTVSGLAYGVDTEAHERSLEFGLKTWAVLGSGLGKIYPNSNLPLSKRILENGGAILSEFSSKTAPDRMHFPQRNRIIAGLADAVLVVESAAKGGSIITAHIAHTYNRDVFALPGSLFDNYHEGCHELVRTNVAALVTSGTQIVEMMNWERQEQAVQTQLFVELNDDEEKVADVLRTQPSSIDKLSEMLPEFTPSKLAGLLLGLELKGVVVCQPGKIYVMELGF